MTRKLRKLHALNGGPVINGWTRFKRPSLPTQRGLKWHRPKAVKCSAPFDAGVLA